MREERLVRFGPEDLTAVIAAIEETGGHIRHRWAGGLVAVLPEGSLDDLAVRLPAGASVRSGPAAAAEDAAKGEEGSLHARALQRRKSPKFQQRKANRPNLDREWGTGDLAEPDADQDDEPHGAVGPELAAVDSPGPAADAVAPQRNERLINSVMVALVIVDAPSAPYSISDDEEVDIVAEVQEGLDWLGDQEPDAKVSWVYDTEVVSVPALEWTGARWPGMPEVWYRGINAALLREDNGAIYFFRDSEYVRFSSVAGGVDAGYPKPIADGWKGMPAAFNAGIDAALWRQSNGAVYFFKGDHYVRFSKVADGMDAGYPKSIASGWPGMPSSFNDGIDAALLRKDNGKIYLFKGDQYVRFSSVAAGVDVGYPKPIADGWKGMPDEYNAGIDAALWRNSNSSVYFFKKKRIWGTYVRFTDVAAGMDDDYPRPIGLSTEEAESLWRDPALAQLGFPAGADGARQYLDSLRDQHNTPWGIVAFITKQRATWFGYASTPKIVMQVGSNGISDLVFAHETGHTFGAPDEYKSSNCTCGEVFGRFTTAPNNNCANCTPDPAVPCLMKSNSPSLCEYTPKHFGWHAFLTGIDAAVWRVDNNRAYLFSGDQYIRYTDIAAGRDESYPAPIAGNWKGLPAVFRQGIDAALWREDNNALYFFKGNQYVRFSKVSDGVDAGYPKLISDGWKGMPAAFNAGVDAALWRESNGAIYFFKGIQYVRFSKVSDGMDAGYPKSISNGWPGMPSSFNDGVDAALMRKDNGKIYLFEGRRYVRFTSVAAGVDSGYPAWIDGNWMPFPK